MNAISTLPNSGMWARGVNAFLGLWLVLSTFFWPHTAAQATNTWILGVLAVVFAGVAAYAAPKVRYLNTAIAVWLFISAFALPILSAATLWNSAIVGVIMFVCSLVPNGPGDVARFEGPSPT